MKCAKAIVFSWACTLSLGVVACGDDDGATSGGGSTPISTGIDPTKSIADLTDAEVKTLYETDKAALADTNLITGMCTLTGIVAGITLDGSGEATVDITACEAARDTCVAEGTPIVTSADCDSATLPTDCTAPIEEFEACSNAQLALADEMFAGISCSSELTEMTGGQATEPADPPECVVLDDKCPGLNEAEESVGAPGPDSRFFANDDQCDEPGMCDVGTGTTDCNQVGAM